MQAHWCSHHQVKTHYAFMPGSSGCQEKKISATKNNALQDTPDPASGAKRSVTSPLTRQLQQQVRLRLCTTQDSRTSLLTCQNLRSRVPGTFRIHRPDHGPAAELTAYVDSDNALSFIPIQELTRNDSFRPHRPVSVVYLI